MCYSSFIMSTYIFISEGLLILLVNLHLLYTRTSIVSHSKERERKKGIKVCPHQEGSSLHECRSLEGFIFLEYSREPL